MLFPVVYNAPPYFEVPLANVELTIFESITAVKKTAPPLVTAEHLLNIRLLISTYLAAPAKNNAPPLAPDVLVKLVLLIKEPMIALDT